MKRQRFWLGRSRGFGSHAIRLRSGMRLLAHARPARARPQTPYKWYGKRVWQNPATTPESFL
ncbi:hypothetical protein SAMN05216345_103549 [Cupriavidus sp. YR651]|nr:hypothetical protein SAMN05216345_103549 [Cupriavidus sp. YR651]